MRDNIGGSAQVCALSDIVLLMIRLRYLSFWNLLRL